MRAFTIALLLTSGTTWTAQAAWWEVPTDSDTTAEVRGVLVPRLREHRRDVRAHKAHLRHLAAQEAQEAAPVAPVATYSGGCLSDAQIAAYARGAGFPESVIPDMVYIAAHRNGSGESGGCPWKINPESGACGLWQIYPAQPGCTDPAANAAMAYEKYQDRGLSPWSV